MGARNVTGAFLRWSHLEDRPFRVLVYMALITMDGDERGPARLYFGGWEALAEVALGRAMPAAPPRHDESDAASEARRVRHAARVAVTATITTLQRAGALSTVRAGGGGRRAEYLLNLDVIGYERQAEPVPERQAEPVPERQAEPVPERQAEPVPHEQQRSHRGLPQERDHLSGGGHLGDRPAGDKQMSPGVGPRAALAVIERAGGGGEPSRERPPWCGLCYEPTRLRWSEPPDGGECLGRCPVCHPMAGRR